MRPDDGLLDIVLVTTADRDKLQESLANWQEGDLDRPDLTRHRASRVELEWSGFDVHLDDEAWPPEGSDAQPPLNDIELKVERDALEFLGPRPKATP
jgi:diacylglycerol kinase family enzyme